MSSPSCTQPGWAIPPLHAKHRGTGTVASGTLARGTAAPGTAASGSVARAGRASKAPLHERLVQTGRALRGSLNFPMKKRFLRKFPSSFHGGGGGERDGMGRDGRDGTGRSPRLWVLLPTGVTPSPGGSGKPIAPWVRRGAGRPRGISALRRPHSVYFIKGCSASPPANHTPQKCCRLRRSPLLPAPDPRGRTSPGRGWHAGCSAPCPPAPRGPAALGTSRGDAPRSPLAPKILSLTSMQIPGAHQEMLPAVGLGFPAPRHADAVGAGGVRSRSPRSYAQSLR